MNKSYDAVIVGGGVNGSSIAFQLAKRGFKVAIIEKDQLACKASRAAAGMLGAQTELTEDGPLFQLARKSRAMFPALADELRELSGIDIGLVNKGMLKIALTKEEKEELKKIITLQRQLGEETSWLEPEELINIEPGLSDRILGAMYIPHDGHVSAPDLSMAFAKSAAFLGADIEEYTEVIELIFDQGKVKGVITNTGNIYTDQIIVTAGAWSGRLLRESGIHIFTFPVKGECFSVLTHKPLIEKTVFSHGCYLVPKKGGRLVVGATMIENTFDEHVSLGGLSGLMERAKEILPAIEKAKWEKAWAGIRPQTEDGLPYIGKHPKYEGLWIATGHYRNGILLSPITGLLIADLIERQPVDEKLLSAFSFERKNNLTSLRR
jgi:glycine oxidase